MATNKKKKQTKNNSEKPKEETQNRSKPAPNVKENAPVKETVTKDSKADTPKNAEATPEKEEEAVPKTCKCHRCCMFHRRPKCFMCHLFGAVVSHLLCMLFFSLYVFLVLAGFVLFIIVRDDPSVTFDLCAADASSCFKAIVNAVKPYLHPYKMIAYLRVQGYIHFYVCSQTIDYSETISPAI